jgi:hypothetical protein
MATRITLEFDGSNISAKSIVNMLKSVGLFHVVEENTLPKETQQAVSDTMKGKGKKHKTVSSLMDDLMTD